MFRDGTISLNPSKAKQQLINYTYDPTNGTVSFGGIFRVGGQPTGEPPETYGGGFLIGVLVALSQLGVSLAPILAGSIACTRAIHEAAAAMYALQHEVLAAQDIDLDTEPEAGRHGEIAQAVDAAVAGQLDVVKELLSGGANIDAQDLRGRTALHEAARKGRVEVAEFLIQAGARANLKDALGQTPLDTAQASNHGEGGAARAVSRPGPGTTAARSRAAATTPTTASALPRRSSLSCRGVFSPSTCWSSAAIRPSSVCIPVSTTTPDPRP